MDLTLELYSGMDAVCHVKPLFTKSCDEKVSYLVLIFPTSQSVRIFKCDGLSYWAFQHML